MKARTTIATALALTALAAPAAHANIPWDPNVTHWQPLYRCATKQHGRVILISTHTPCHALVRKA